MQLWDTRSTDLIWGTNIGSKYVEFGDFSPDSDRIILAETVGAIVLLDASDGTMIWRRDGCEAGHTGVAWSSREEDIYVACGDGSVRVLDAGTGEERRRWSAHDGPVTDMALSADGSTLVTCAGATLIAGDNWARLITADPGTPALAVWEAESGRLRRRDTSFSSGLTAVALAHDGSMLAVGDAAGRVVVQPVEEGPPHLDRELPHGSIEAIAFSHDRERLAVATSDGRTTILDVASGGELLTLPMDIRTHALAFTPDDETLIAGSRSPFTIYETRRPPGELIERRRLMARARAIVEPMFEEVWLAQALAAALREDMTLPDALRDAAVAYVTRRGDAFAHLVSVSVITARDPKYPLERMRRALKAMQMIREHGRAPARAYDEIIALLHYRVGDYESAAREMQRYLTWDERPDRDGAAELAIVAMIEQARGRRAEALDAWRRAEEANARAGRFSNETAAMIWTEAAAIFGGREG